MKAREIKVPVGSMIETNQVKMFRSENANFNFNKVNGYTEMWGATEQDDVEVWPFPNILDIEITTICNGPDNKLCSFCSPAGTPVDTPDGEVAIENILPGDRVWSATSLSTSKPRPRVNVVQEVYQREYEGEMICIELENGKVLELTPEHPVMVKGGIEVLAGDLTDQHEIIHLSDFQECKTCGGVVTSENRTKRYYCSDSCHEGSKTKCECLICCDEFSGRKNSKFCSDCVDYGTNNSYHPLRNIYHSMLYRCYNSDRNNYEYYGHKGVTVHDDWLIFENFIKDMYPSYEEGMELERLDNDKPYSVDNCKWLCKREQRVHRSQPKTSSRPYKGVSLSGNKYTLKCFGEYRGMFVTQKNCVDEYNKIALELFPENGGKYIQVYEGEK